MEISLLKYSKGNKTCDVAQFDCYACVFTFSNSCEVCIFTKYFTEEYPIMLLLEIICKNWLACEVIISFFLFFYLHQTWYKYWNYDEKLNCLPRTGKKWLNKLND